MRCLRRRDIDQREPFPARGVGETLVERDNLERRWAPFGCHESRRKLKRVGRSQRMNAKKSDCIFSNNLAGFDFVPSGSQLFEPVEGE